MEQAIVDGAFDPYTGEWESEEARARYPLTPCPEPGSNRFNPYVTGRHKGLVSS